MSNSDGDKRKEALDKLVELKIDLQLLEEVDIEMEESKTRKELIKIRRLTATEENRAVIINSGLCIRLVEFLSLDKYSTIHLESAWILCNVAAGTSKQTKYVTGLGCVNHFIRLLSSELEDVVEQVIWGLGNFVAESIELRDIVINSGALHHIVSTYDNATRISVKRTIAWVISNFVREKPYPTKETLDAALKFIVKSLLHETDNAILTETLWAVSCICDSPENEMDKFKSFVDELISSNVLPIIIDHAFSTNTKIYTPANKTIDALLLAEGGHYCQILIEAGLLKAFSFKFERRDAGTNDIRIISSLIQISINSLQAVLDAQIYRLFLQSFQNLNTASAFDACKVIAKSFLNSTSEQFNQLISFGCLEFLCKYEYNHNKEMHEMVFDAIEHILQFPNKNESQKDNIYARMIDECGGFQKLQKFSDSGDDEWVKKTNHIISTYFHVNNNDGISKWSKDTIAKDLDNLFSGDCVCLMDR